MHIQLRSIIQRDIFTENSEITRMTKTLASQHLTCGQSITQIKQTAKIFPQYLLSFYLLGFFSDTPYKKIEEIQFQQHTLAGSFSLCHLLLICFLSALRLHGLTLEIRMKQTSGHFKVIYRSHTRFSNGL